MRFLCLSLAILLIGCRNERPVMLLEPNDRSYTVDELQAMGRAGRPVHGTNWYSAEELDWIARDYAATQHIDFNFQGTSALIWVSRKTEYLATLEYGHRIGEPVLIIEIGLDGRVRKHLLATAIDGSAFFGDRPKEQ